MNRENELSSILIQSREAGVRRLAPADAASVTASAHGQGFAVFHVDLFECGDKAAILAKIADSLCFPDWFGHNLDALGDCLGDMSWCPAKGYVTIFEHVDGTHAEKRSGLAAVLEVFDCAAGDWADADIPFWTFVASDNDEAAQPGP